MRKYLLPGNRLPRFYTYEQVVDGLDDTFRGPLGYELGLGPNTIAWWERTNIMPAPVVVAFRNDQILRLYERGMVKLIGDYDKKYSRSAIRRMDAALQGIGKRLINHGGRWKIYTIATGEWEDYKKGMVITK